MLSVTMGKRLVGVRGMTVPDEEFGICQRKKSANQEGKANNRICCVYHLGQSSLKS